MYLHQCGIPNYTINGFKKIGNERKITFDNQMAQVQRVKLIMWIVVKTKLEN